MATRTTAGAGVLERLRTMGRQDDVATVVEHHLPGNVTALDELFALLGRATPGTYDFIAGLIEFQRRHAVGGQFYQAITGLMRSLGLEKARRAPAGAGSAAKAPKPKREKAAKPKKSPKEKTPRARKPKHAAEAPSRVPEGHPDFEEYTYAAALAGGTAWPELTAWDIVLAAAVGKGPMPVADLAEAVGLASKALLQMFAPTAGAYNAAWLTWTVDTAAGTLDLTQARTWRTPRAIEEAVAAGSGAAPRAAKQ